MQQTQGDAMVSIPGSGRFPWKRAWQSTPVPLPGESHGQRRRATVHGATQSRTQLKPLNVHRGTAMTKEGKSVCTWADPTISFFKSNYRQEKNWKTAKRGSKRSGFTYYSELWGKENGNMKDGSYLSNKKGKRGDHGFKLTRLGHLNCWKLPGSEEICPRWGRNSMEHTRKGLAKRITICRVDTSLG